MHDRIALKEGRLQFAQVVQLNLRRGMQAPLIGEAEARKLAVF